MLLFVFFCFLESHFLAGGIVGDVPRAFSDATTPAAFLAQYGRPKPRETEPLVFMCKIGRRSEMAANSVISLGFKK